MKNRKCDLEPYIDMDTLEEIIYDAIHEAIEKADFSNRTKPLFFSISMKIEPDGKAVVESFGNMASMNRITGQAPEKKQQEIFVELIESDSDYLITMEIPCTNMNDFSVSVADNKLVVSGLIPDAFYKQVVFEKPVDPEKVKKIFNNSILEIIVPKKK